MDVDSARKKKTRLLQAKRILTHITNNWIIPSFRNWDRKKKKTFEHLNEWRNICYYFHTSRQMWLKKYKIILSRSIELSGNWFRSWFINQLKSITANIAGLASHTRTKPTKLSLIWTDNVKKKNVWCVSNTKTGSNKDNFTKSEK